MSNVDVPHDNDSAGNEIESPVDGPTPDWMRMATSSSGEPSLTDENTPDWLKEIQSGRTKSAAGPAASAPADDEMSDLARLLAEEGIDLNTVEEDIPQEAAGMSARDWMIATSDDEMIRKRVGATDFNELSAASEDIFAEEDEDPFAGMSDLERLLAEEGVDLSSVEEDVPPEAAGMSARDWMISTSDDEMIRKRVGATTFGEPEEKPAAKEEPLLAGDLPDWLQDVADEPEPAFAAADDMMVVEEDLPDWLQDAAEEPEFSAATEEDLLMVEEDLPDWLQDVEDVTPEFEPAAASAVEDDKMVVEEDLPDWLRDVEDEVKMEPLVAVADSPVDVADEDLPDWLRDVEEEISTEAEPIALAESAEDDKMVVEEDLPDWLQDVADETPAGVAAAAALSTSTAEDDKMVVEEDLPDWLQDVADETPVTELAASGEDTELPDWLQEVQEDMDLVTSPTLAAAEAVSLSGDDNIIEEDELPDWLQDVEIDAEDAELEAVVSDIFADVDDEDLPDWLTEVQAQADEAFEPSEPAPLEPEEMAADDLPDWLQEVEEEAELTLAEEEELEQLVAETTQDEGLIDEEGLPDWLQEVEAEPEPAVESAPPPAPTPLVASAPEPPLQPQPEPKPQITAEPAPVPPAEKVIQPVAPKPAAPGVPDWLKKLREGDRQPQPVAPAPAPAPVVAAVAPPAPPVASPSPPPVRPAPAPAPVAAGVQPVATPAAVEKAPAINLPAAPDDRLKLAQAARDEGDLDKAAYIYETLVNSGAYLDTVINDIEMIIRSFPMDYRLYQVKGDAMMRDGRLQGALDSYRKALERLPG